MADPIRVLLSQTTFNTDGATTVWNFSFSGGYLEQSHVKAQKRDTATGDITQIVLTPGMFTGPYQLTLSPALAVGYELTIYRNTPKTGPLVDFTDRAQLTETALDYSAKQNIFAAAEADDWSTVVAAAVEAVNVYQAAIATGPVASVNGRTGSVVLVPGDITHTKADVGLANVDNTSDVNKPVSTAQAAAISAAASAAQAAAIASAAATTTAAVAANTGGAFRNTDIANAALPAGVTKVIWLAESYDRNSESAASSYTAGKAGIYNFSFFLQLSHTVAEDPMATLYVNNAAVARCWRQTVSGAGNTYPQGTTELLLAAGDVVDLRISLNATGTSYISNVGVAHFAGHFVRN